MAAELSTTWEDIVFPSMLESKPCIPIADDEDSDADPSETVPSWLMLFAADADADADVDSIPEVIATFSPDWYEPPIPILLPAALFVTELVVVEEAFTASASFSLRLVVVVVVTVFVLVVVCDLASLADSALDDADELELDVLRLSDPAARPADAFEVSRDE